MNQSDFFEKTYKAISKQDFVHTTMVTHKGTVVAFALDQQNRMYYSVLELNEHSKERGELDVNYWSEEPVELLFPREIAKAGYGVTGTTLMPSVNQSKKKEVTRHLAPDEMDRHLSSTARLTAAAPFHVLSDGRYVYLFRQAVDAEADDAVFYLNNGQTTGDKNHTLLLKDTNDKPISIVSDTLLVDRFILVGSELKAPMEVRYKRSRKKDTPLSKHDSLGTSDMDGNAFLEPTLELDFINYLSGGRFSVLLLPTQVAHEDRWQIFAFNDRTKKLDSYNIERAENGLFNTKGTRHYTSPDPKYKSDVFERAPGKCPFTNRDLVPIIQESGKGIDALYLEGETDIEIATGFSDTDPYTIEFWTNQHVQTILDPNVWKPDVWNHIVLMSDGVKKTGYVNGVVRDTAEFNFLVEIDGGTILIGPPEEKGGRLIDELRIWSTAKDLKDLEEEKHFRLLGSEANLWGYYRFDEEVELKNDSWDILNLASDKHFGFARKPIWKASDAPIGPHPGIQKTTLSIDSIEVSEGLSSVLYFQQERIVSTHAKKVNHVKQNARVMLAMSTDYEPWSDLGKNYVGILDFGVARDGTLADIPNKVELNMIAADGEVKERLDEEYAQEARNNSIESEIEAIKTNIQNHEKNILLYTWQRDYAHIRELQTRGAIFFDQANYNGNIMPLDHNTTRIAYPTGGWNDRIRSIKIDKGVKVTVWRHASFGGWSFAFYKDWPGGWQGGQLSSILIEYTEEWKEQLQLAKESVKSQESYIPFADRSQFIEICNTNTNKKLQALVEEKKNLLAWNIAELQSLRHQYSLRNSKLMKVKKYNFGETYLPLSLIHADTNGLTVSGGLLEFASIKDAPTLIESHLGRVLLYFRGNDDSFYSVHFDAHCEKQRQEISLKGSPSKLTAVARAVELVPKVLIEGVDEDIENSEEILNDAIAELTHKRKLVKDWQTAKVIEPKLEWLRCKYGIKLGLDLQGLGDTLDWIASSVEITLDENTITGEQSELTSIKEKLEWAYMVKLDEFAEYGVKRSWGIRKGNRQYTKFKIKFLETGGYGFDQDRFNKLNDQFGGRTLDSDYIEALFSEASEFGNMGGAFETYMHLDMEAQAKEIYKIWEGLGSAVENDVKDLKIKVEGLSTKLGHPTLDDEFKRQFHEKLYLVFALQSQEELTEWIERKCGNESEDGYWSNLKNLLENVIKEKIPKNLIYYQERLKVLNEQLDYPKLNEDYVQSLLRLCLSQPNLGINRLDDYHSASDGFQVVEEYINDSPITEESNAMNSLKELNKLIQDKEQKLHFLLDKPPTYTVTIQDENSGLKEVWKEVPTAADKFAQVINGVASEETLIGSVSIIEDDQARLLHPLSQAVSRFTLLKIGSHRFLVMEKAMKGDSILHVMALEDKEVAFSPYCEQVGTINSLLKLCNTISLRESEKIEFVIPNGSVLQIGKNQYTVREKVPIGAIEIPIHPVKEKEFSDLLEKRIDILPYDGVNDKTIGYVGRATNNGDQHNVLISLKTITESESSTEEEGVDMVKMKTIPQGTVLKIGEAFWIVDQASKSREELFKIKFLQGADNDIEGQQTVYQVIPDPVYSMVYDYETNASIENSFTDLSTGSRLVGIIAPMDEQSMVMPISKAVITEGTQPHWVADPPGRALRLNGEQQYLNDQPLTAFQSSLSKGELTLESWINPLPLSNDNKYTVLEHQSAKDQISLSIIGHGGDGDYLVEAKVATLVKGNSVIHTSKSKTTMKGSQWANLAAVYHQSFALSFDGDGANFLQTPHDVSLDLTNDLTIEVFIEKLEHSNLAQGLLAKGPIAGEKDQVLGYALSIAEDNTLLFEFADVQGTSHEFRSSEIINDSFQKVAVTRKRMTKTENKMKPQQVGGKTMQVFSSVEIEHWYEITFYIGGRKVGDTQGYKDQPDPGQNDLDLTIGRVMRNNKEEAFHGIISEVRLWSSVVEEKSLGQKLTGRENGLIAWWQMQENQGRVTIDAKGGMPAHFKGEIEWLNSPDTSIGGTNLKLYHNGELLQSSSSCETVKKYYEDTKDLLSLGGGLEGNYFKGTLEEIRIWKTARTQEQILDNLFGRLTGGMEDLIAYYTFDPALDEDGHVKVDDDDMIYDNGLYGIDLNAKGRDYVMSDAPISLDTAQVKRVFSTVDSEFHTKIESAPVIREYGDIENDGHGDLTGVLKRCYGYIKDGHWHLITGYKIGNLKTEWIGQAQFDPQIMGYVEGAPPVPSENLTMGPKNPKTATFDDASSVKIIEAEDVNYSFSRNKKGGLDAEFEAGGSYGEEFDLGITEVAAPMGVGVATKLSAAIRNKGKFKFDSTKGWDSGKHVSRGQNTSKNLKIGLAGYWEDPDHILNKALGQRFQPGNTGMALVKSETADVFALRMEHTGVLVAFRMMPNPDIPKDVNLIPFPINPRYTKQGTLDGRIGYDEKGVVLDPDYPNSTGYGEYSYFKPKEAYATKRRIEREAQRVKSYYDNHGPQATKDSLGKAAEAFGGGALAGAIAGAIAGSGGAALALTSAGASLGNLASTINDGYDVVEEFARQDIVNTYVWTADGGMYAESTSQCQTKQETVSSNISFSGGIGGSMSTDVKAALISEMSMSGMMGGHFTTTKAKSKKSSSSFAMDVSIGIPGDLQKYEEFGKRVYDHKGQPVLVPGKVDGYRFMTFYLNSSSTNFEDLFAKVIDPMWIEQSDDPNAKALREAQKSSSKKPPCWRVFHRVTFQSRILPEFPDETAPPMLKAMKAMDFSSNWELLQGLKPFVSHGTHSNSTFATAVRTALQKHMPGLVPHSEEIIELARTYFEVGQ